MPENLDDNAEMLLVRTEIYALMDECGLVRYIGKTSYGAEKRLVKHLAEARRGGVNHRCNWIRSIMSRGIIPTVAVIEEVDGNGDDAEMAWIAYFRECGVKLVNGTKGGGGGVIGRAMPPMSESAKRQISITLMGHDVSDVTRKRISLANLGKKHGPHSPEAIENIRAGNLGKKHAKHRFRTAEHRAKISENKRRWWAERKAVHDAEVV